jgi:UTP--glucose-1-phosphate uridylyltransferase
MVKDGNVYVEKTKGRWMTTGDPKNYNLASLYYATEFEDYGQSLVDFLQK